MNPLKQSRPDVIQREEPIRGVKLAAVVAVTDDAVGDGEALRFQGTTSRLHHSRCYDAEATAVCQSGRDHRVPAWDCTCGFYAMPDDDRLASGWAGVREAHWARLVVELSGRVVEHEHGWRGSRQVVHEASWEDRCLRCSQPGATGFALSERRSGYLAPACRSCAGEAWLSPSDISGRLGTDVRLLPAGPTSAPAPLDPAATRHRWRTRLVRRVVLLVTLGGAVAVALAAASQAGRVTSSDALVRELAPLIRVAEPEATAQGLAARFSGNRSATVLADTGLLRRTAGQLVSAVAVGEQVDVDGASTYRCRIVVVGGRPDPEVWNVVERPAADGPSCAAQAVSLRHPVEPAG